MLMLMSLTFYLHTEMHSLFISLIEKTSGSVDFHQQIIFPFEQKDVKNTKIQNSTWVCFVCKSFIIKHKWYYPYIQLPRFISLNKEKAATQTKWCWARNKYWLKLHTVFIVAYFHLPLICLCREFCSTTIYLKISSKGTIILLICIYSFKGH